MQICFKCQEKAIIVYEFKADCVKLSNNFDQLDDMIAYDEEEDVVEFDFGEESAMDSSEYEQYHETNSDSQQPEEIHSETSNEPQTQQNTEEFIFEEEVISDNGTYEIIDGRFHCNICGNLFKNRESLGRHMIRHKSKPKLKCPYCPRNFYFARDINFHIKQHTEPLPEYKCQICSKNYSSTSALKKHLQLHTESKKFRCTFSGCNLVFARKFTMQNHLRTHDGCRPFKCPVDSCESTFIQKNILQRHMKACHNENYYKCEYCKEKSFDKKSDLKLHYTACDEFLNSRH